MMGRTGRRKPACADLRAKHAASIHKPRSLDRKALLLGTALASTFLGTVVVPTPAQAILTCADDVGPTPISHLTEPQSIVCVNTEARRATGVEAAINLSTTGDDFSIFLDSEGRLQADNAGFAFGIRTTTVGARSDITIENRGDINQVTGSSNAGGILAFTLGDDSPISITHSGDIDVSSLASNAYGISAESVGADSPVSIESDGRIEVSSGGGYAFGIRARTSALDSHVTIVNSGDILATAGKGNAFGIFAQTSTSSIRIENSGSLTPTSSGLAVGIFTQTKGKNSPISVDNFGDIDVTSSNLIYAMGIFAENYGDGKVSINNSGKISASAGVRAIGIFAETAQGDAVVVNSGDISVNSNTDIAVGILAQSYGSGGDVSIENSGNISIGRSGTYSGGIVGITEGDDSSVSISNSGTITATHGPKISAGIYSGTSGDRSGITIRNVGAISANGTNNSTGLIAIAGGQRSPVTIDNSGSVHGGRTGIYTGSAAGVTITNSGNIGASSQQAIAAVKGPVEIFNSGTITGFVMLDADDRFTNQAGGTFEARQTSDFDAFGEGGSDLFRNEAGGTVHANGGTRFVNLERFENRGLISMVDWKAGDSFTISNTVGGTDLDFVAFGGSTLAVDAFLSGPGKSKSDTLTIEGDVSGVTTVQVVNTNQGPGVFNPEGFRVVTVTGATPNPNAFQMAQPVDTGFFDYDLYFVPTGSGFWELRSFPGGGAFLLPQLVTAAQDIWHEGSSTWFDRTADLRVLMAGGAAPTAYDPGGKSLSASGPYPLTPAVWARGSGSWLDRDDTQRTTAYGRDYTIDLDRELTTLDFQAGVDMGKRDVMSQGDALVFGLLGGFVHGDLNYDTLARQFDFDGGQVGVYATYLNGGLFVDTLVNAHLYSLDTNTLGFPSSLDANTIGVRTDTGYRFGSFSGGPFLEPLATLEVTWADIDGFSLGGNTVSFDDDANVRGRLGLRAGTTTQVWDSTLMEPFVIGSLWGNFTEDNSATLVSTGRTFRFQDQLDDVWGEVSAGVNFFNFSQTTAVFATPSATTSPASAAKPACASTGRRAQGAKR